MMAAFLLSSSTADQNVNARTEPDAQTPITTNIHRSESNGITHSKDIGINIASEYPYTHTISKYENPAWLPRHNR